MKGYHNFDQNLTAKPPLPYTFEEAAARINQQSQYTSGSVLLDAQNFLKCKFGHCTVLRLDGGQIFSEETPLS
jgi:hypothetical protein